MATDITKITNIRVRLDVKRIRDGGSDTISNAATGKVITFTKSFADVDNIQVTPALNTTDAPVGYYDFVDVANPTYFTAYLIATKGANAGNKVTGDFSWTAEGI